MEYTAELVSTSLAHNNAILKTLVNTTDQLAILEPSSDIIGAKPNFYCEAIELVCGGSPRICVLVEWKALDRAKSEL